MPVSIGSRLGSYEILALIGAGGMGEVYRARDTRLSRDVAIKVLPLFLSDDPGRLRRFEQEARAAAALNHPNILAVFQMGTYEGAPYLVSELLEGAPLREQLKRGPMPLRKVIDCGVQIARGMSAAHEKGIMHRDLKPENLFVTKDGRVKILDFGLAKLTQRSWIVDSNAPTHTSVTEPGVVLGTVGYMSPEQVSGKAADGRADIFAFGAILYEMLTGKRAFQKPTAAETMSAILNEDPRSVSQFAPTTPPALQRVVQHCLEKNPEQRFQSASDLAFALEALSDSGASSTANAQVSSRHVIHWAAVAASFIVVAVALTAIFHLRRPTKVSNHSTWVQLTNFPDSATQPALSLDGRMLTFVRGGSTFAGPGQIYIKVLPDGEAAQLTRDDSEKMSPAFSPDSSEIAYTVVEANHWDTWLVPTTGGQPRLWLPNSSGLVWLGKGKLAFSEIKDNDMHMAVVTSDESRAGERDIYVPVGLRGMAHRTYQSPDGKSALVVEMDRGFWLPCRLVPMGGSSPGRQVGPAGAGCTSAAWSADGMWMYLNSDAGGAFHIWRQRFTDGEPEQLTSGPTEEEGIAVATDGRSFITSVGLRQSSVFVHDSGGDRQVSVEGFSYDPKFTPDGKRLCYRILNGASLESDPSQLRAVELDSGQDDPLLPGFSVIGEQGMAYDLSPDSRNVVVSAPDEQGKRRLWVAPLDRSSAPHEIPGIQGDEPLFGPAREILFRAIDGGSAFAYSVHEDGSALRKVAERPIAGIEGVSPDREWLVVKLPGTAGAYHVAFPIRGGAAVSIISFAATHAGDINVQWSSDGRRIFIPVSTARVPLRTAERTWIVPLARGQIFPQIPKEGFSSESEIGKLPGARLIDAAQAVPGQAPDMYAFVRSTIQRNLYRIPLP